MRCLLRFALRSACLVVKPALSARGKVYIYVVAIVV